jgi:hypothetical protein
MATHGDNSSKYSVNSKLAALTSRCTALEQECAALRAHLKASLETSIADAKNLIHSSVRADFREQQDALGQRFEALQASIRIPRDGVDGPRGERGERGDVAVVTSSELSEAVLRLRKQHAKFLGALQHARELNNQEPSVALKRTIENVLSTIERTAL